VRNRWLQLSLGILAMVMIANVQYGWAPFVPPMVEANHLGESPPPSFGRHSAHAHRSGRESTVFIVFMPQGAAIGTRLLVANNPVLFVPSTGFTFFTAGEIYRLFPATSGDLYGRVDATTKYALLHGERRCIVGRPDRLAHHRRTGQLDCHLRRGDDLRCRDRGAGPRRAQTTT